jgi:hypothetical protein
VGRDASWTLGDCAILLEDAVGVYATHVPEGDPSLVRSVIVAVAGLKAAASSYEGAELPDALWLARTLALDAADACRTAPQAPYLARCAALCSRAAAACEAGIREHARRP